MNEIKPIETYYHGCRFRSRLEARWAVFFDACGADWEYEPEGFKLENETKYLPDFLLKNVVLDERSGFGNFNLYGVDKVVKKLWVEVKGEIKEQDIKKMSKFSFGNFKVQINNEDASRCYYCPVYKKHASILDRMRMLSCKGDCDCSVSKRVTQKSGKESRKNSLILLTNIPYGKNMEELYRDLEKIIQKNNSDIENVEKNINKGIGFSHLIFPFNLTSVSGWEGPAFFGIGNDGRFGLFNKARYLGNGNFDFTRTLDQEKTCDAYLKARKARFEWGENG